MTENPASHPVRVANFTRAYTLSASHRLHTEALSAEENRTTFGKCNNPHGHGHNYRIEVTVAGPISADTGMVVNMTTLDAVVGNAVVARFDHMNLNLDPLSRSAYRQRRICVSPSTAFSRHRKSQSSSLQPV